jgi:hypothetical protein
MSIFNHEPSTDEILLMLQQAIADNKDDTEFIHRDMDRVLVAVLRWYGHHAAADFFEGQGKWYA